MRVTGFHGSIFKKFFYSKIYFSNRNGQKFPRTKQCPVPKKTLL